MTWVMPVNDMLQDEITKLNYTLIPSGFRGDLRTIRLMHESLSRIIDDLGEQSAHAQGLNKVITTAEKMHKTPANTLYLLKDAHANGGLGLVIGFLKVGQKKLFLYDMHAQVIESEPLCVLDFYVLRHYQRHGHGKRLFDHMLQEEGVSPAQLAIDSPSEKMRTFMRKNYELADFMQQSNNFTAVPEFFQLAKQKLRPISGRSTPVVIQQMGRYSAHRLLSTIGTVIHGSAGGGDGSSYHCRSNNGSASGEPSPGAKAEVQSQQKAEVLQAPVPHSRHCSLHIEKTPALGPAPALFSLQVAGVVAPRDTQFTDQDYFDIKFYHKKL